MSRLSVIKKSGDFSLIIKNGHGISCPFFIFYLKNDEGENRFGICAGKKLGCAVLRNRIKRRIRELIRHYLPEFVLFGSLVIVARKPAAEAGFDELRKAFHGMSLKLGLLKTA